MKKDKDKKKKEREKQKRELKEFDNIYKYDKNGKKLTIAQRNKLILNASSKKRKEYNKEYEENKESIGDENYQGMKYKYNKVETIIFADWSDNPRDMKQVFEKDF